MVLTANAAFTERHILESLIIPDPVAGAAVRYPVPANEVIQVVGLHFQFNTAVAVADRRVSVFAYQDAGTNVVQASPASIVQAANLIWLYDFSCGISPVDASGDAAPRVFAPLACGLQLQAGEELRIVAFAIAAADQFLDISMRCYRWKED